MIVIFLLSGILLIRTTGYFSQQKTALNSTNTNKIVHKSQVKTQKISQQSVAKTQSATVKKISTQQQLKDPKQMRRPMNWQLSSETLAYPVVSQYPNLWIHVSIEKQRVYLMNGSNK